MRLNTAFLVLAASYGLVSVGASQKRIKVQVVDSGSAEVDQLVVQLVSRRPAPLPIVDGTLPPWFHSSRFYREYPNGRYETKAVTAAVQNLTALGPKALPYLVKHLDDNRYCYSTLLPSRSTDDAGWIDCSVGDAVRYIVQADCSTMSYRDRRNRDGEWVGSPTFWMYVESAGGIDAWASKAANQTRKQILLSYIDWCVEIERKNGFGSEDQKRRFLEGYAEWRKREQDGADQPATAPKSKTEGKEKPKPEPKVRPQ